MLIWIFDIGKTKELPYYCVILLEFLNAEDTRQNAGKKKKKLSHFYVDMDQVVDILKQGHFFDRYSRLYLLLHHLHEGACSDRTSGNAMAGAQV